MTQKLWLVLCQSIALLHRVMEAFQCLTLILILVMDNVSPQSPHDIGEMTDLIITNEDAMH